MPNYHCLEINYRRYRLFSKSISQHLSQILTRFADSTEVIASFSIFDPLAVPEHDTEGFKEYGVREVKILGTHFLKGEEGAIVREQLLTEWSSMKYHLKDVVKPKVPIDIREGKRKSTSTERCLLQLLSLSEYKQFFPRLTFIAEVAASLPVTNAWPERGQVH